MIAVKEAVRQILPSDGSPMKRRKLIDLVALACPEVARSTISAAIVDMVTGRELERPARGVYRLRMSR